MTTFAKYNRGGFTLIELVIIIVILGIVSAVAIPRFGNLSESAKLNATKDEMLRIKRAIIGDPQVVSGGEYINRGFEGDVGHAPASLSELVAKPDSIAAYDKFSRIGWNGPYIDSTGNEYLSDAWGQSYTYNPSARTLAATGPDPDITISF